MSGDFRRPVHIVEVGPRDGLQNESAPVSTTEKLRYLELLVAAGLTRIEVTSFVNPALVPQMADAEQVLAAFDPPPGIEVSALILNRRGLERALVAGVGRVNFVVAASDEFSLRNQGCDTSAGLARFAEASERARAAHLPTTLTVAVAFGCPFSGEVDPTTVMDIVRRGVDLGADEIAIADTIGVATPLQVSRLVGGVAGAVDRPLRAHFHNTRNTGYSNAYAAVANGVSALDASAGGIGGCPFAPNATGNIATEDLLWSLQRDQLAVGPNVDAVVAAANFIGDVIGKEVPAQLGRVSAWPPAGR